MERGDFVPFHIVTKDCLRHVQLQTFLQTAMFDGSLVFVPTLVIGPVTKLDISSLRVDMQILCSCVFHYGYFS